MRIQAIAATDVFILGKSRHKSPVNRALNSLCFQSIRIFFDFQGRTVFIILNQDHALHYSHFSTKRVNIEIPL